jgi:aryl-alcohol dehydrogenase-like predicted oxidoreductase
MGECNKETTFSILDYFYSSVGNFIDTANMYMAGESETWLGEWMELRGVRDEMVVTTKYTVPLKRAEDEGKILSNHGGNNKKSLRVSLAGSLKRLRTDYVDIFYVHGWEGTTTIVELMRSLDDVVKSGKVLYLGISNTPAWVVVKANDYARAHALTASSFMRGGGMLQTEILREKLFRCVKQKGWQ